MQLLKGCLFICVMCILTSFVHPIKISTCIIKSQKDKEKIFVEFNFFADDFGAHLKEISRQQINLSTFPKKTKEEVLNYINKHFTFQIKNEVIRLTYNSFSFKENVFHIEFETSTIKIVPKAIIKIKNTLLFEAFDNQSNMLRIDLKGDENYDTYRFNKKKQNIEIIL